MLELNTDEPFLLASISHLSSGMELIWENRKFTKSTNLNRMRADLESSISINRRSRLRKVREAADLMDYMVDNFLNQLLLCISKVLIKYMKIASPPHPTFLRVLLETITIMVK